MASLQRLKDQRKLTDDARKRKESARKDQRKLTDDARKRKESERKGRTRVNFRPAFISWQELWEIKGGKMDAEQAFLLLDLLAMSCVTVLMQWCLTLLAILFSTFWSEAHLAHVHSWNLTQRVNLLYNMLTSALCLEEFLASWKATRIPAQGRI